MTELDPGAWSSAERGRFLSAAVSPRPIAWLSTRSAAGVDNLAPFSAYTHVSATPPIVAVALSRRENGEPKDTERNALETEAFAVNVVTESLLERVDATAADLPPTESEFDAATVERAACVRIDPPRVADAPLAMECTLHDSTAVGDRTLLFGEVAYVHADEGLVDTGSEAERNGALDANALAAIGHVGRTTYARTEPLEGDR